VELKSSAVGGYKALLRAVTSSESGAGVDGRSFVEERDYVAFCCAYARWCFSYVRESAWRIRGCEFVQRIAAPVL
jgi:hypothetical protein